MKESNNPDESKAIPENFDSGYMQEIPEGNNDEQPIPVKDIPKPHIPTGEEMFYVLIGNLHRDTSNNNMLVSQMSALLGEALIVLQVSNHPLSYPLINKIHRLLYGTNV